MAYRRKQITPRSTTFEDHRSSSASGEEPGSASSLAAQAIRASSAHRGSSLSSAYGESAYRISTASPTPREAIAYEYTSMKNLNESKYGFWDVLSRKAKTLLDEDTDFQKSDGSSKQSQMQDTLSGGQYHQSYRSPENFQKIENPTFQKGSESITSSIIGGTIKNVFEDCLRNVEHKTADIIQETRKLQIKRKGSHSNSQVQATDSQILTDQETQLKSSRDEANATAAKTKLLLRELKTVKADLAFAKERCRQLEEENKILRDSQDKGDIAKDDDLIRLQLETLLAEKARLAHENSVLARENRFLREIVEYHQLTMQGVIYMDEGIEDDTQVYPFLNLSPSHLIPKLSPSSLSSSHPHLSSSLNPIIIQEKCPVSPTPSTPPPQIATINTSSNPSIEDGPLMFQNSTNCP